MDAHLILKRAARQRIAFAEAAVRIHQELGHDEQRNTLHRVRRPGDLGEHEVNDVLGKVVLAGRDENLGAGDGVAAVGLRLGAGLQETQVRAAMRLGQVHGSGPAARNHVRNVGLPDLFGGLGQQCGDRTLQCARAEQPSLRLRGAA